VKRKKALLPLLKKLKIKFVHYRKAQGGSRKKKSIFRNWFLCKLNKNITLNISQLNKNFNLNNITNPLISSVARWRYYDARKLIPFSNAQSPYTTLKTKNYTSIIPKN